MARNAIAIGVRKVMPEARALTRLRGASMSIEERKEPRIDGRLGMPARAPLLEDASMAGAAGFAAGIGDGPVLPGEHISRYPSGRGIVGWWDRLQDETIARRLI